MSKVTMPEFPDIAPTDDWDSVIESVNNYAKEHAAACVREALEQAYGKLDEVGEQLQQAREDGNIDYWQGVGAMVEAGEEAIRALITKQ